MSSFFFRLFISIIKIISELERENFNRKDVSITFSKFNEPMYNFDLLRKRVLQLRLYLKNVRLLINTNGDFINKEIIETAAEILKKKKTVMYIDKIKFEEIEDGLAVQMMHTGSYDSETESFEKMKNFCLENKYL